MAVHAGPQPRAAPRNGDQVKFTYQPPPLTKPSELTPWQQQELARLMAMLEKRDKAFEPMVIDQKGFMLGSDTIL